jgi:hypothetical protein
MLVCTIYKHEASEIKEWIEKEYKFDRIKELFIKKYKRNLPFETEYELIEVVERKLKIKLQLPEESPTQKQDWEFLWHRFGLNKRCIKCSKKCKQHAGCVVEYCPLFVKKI